ncbi:MAG: WD40 repeat domain-containing protein, partial [bacterium]|nr:WD40 repeat domain-containing protein [bacterium]
GYYRKVWQYYIITITAALGGAIIVSGILLILGRITVYDLVSGEITRTFTGEVGPADTTCGPMNVTFSPDGRYLAAPDCSLYYYIWQIEFGMPLHRLDAHDAYGSKIAFLPNGDFIHHTAFTVQRLSRGEAAWTQDFHQWGRDMALSPDGSRVVTVGGDFEIEQEAFVEIRDAATGEIVHTLAGHTYVVNSVDYSPDGTLLATGGSDQTVRVWDAATGTARFTLAEAEGEVISVAFQPGSRLLAAVSADHTVRLWDASNGELVTTLALPPGHRGNAVDPTRWGRMAGTIPERFDVVFSPDGSQLASVGGDGIRLWNPTAHQHLAFVEHPDGARVVFAPEGARLASANETETIVWSADTLEPLATVPGGYPLAFSPDGTRLATRDYDARSIQLWAGRESV